MWKNTNYGIIRVQGGITYEGRVNGLMELHTLDNVLNGHIVTQLSTKCPFTDHSLPATIILEREECFAPGNWSIIRVLLGIVPCNYYSKKAGIVV